MPACGPALREMSLSQEAPSPVRIQYMQFGGAQTFGMWARPQ